HLCRPEELLVLEWYDARVRRDADAAGIRLSEPQCGAELWLRQLVYGISAEIGDWGGWPRNAPAIFVLGNGGGGDASDKDECSASLYNVPRAATRAICVQQLREIATNREHGLLRAVWVTSQVVD